MTKCLSFGKVSKGDVHFTLKKKERKKKVRKGKRTVFSIHF